MKNLEKCALEPSSGGMKEEESMLEVREMRWMNIICVFISFDVVKIQELMHKIHAKINTRSKYYEVNQPFGGLADGPLD